MKPTYKIFSGILTMLFSVLLSSNFSFATNRVSIASGDWNSSATWYPSGSPSPTDNISIASGHTVTVSTNQTIHNVVINTGGKLTWSTTNTLSITGNLNVYGTVAMNGGNISLTNFGLQFSLGSSALFTWEPGNNTLGGATLFTNGVESFSPTSKLIIKKWFNYAVPLPSVITGNFGNLELNTFNGNTITEWNQNNGFQSNQVLGTLTIDQGWITLDKSGSISNTTIGNIVLKSVNSTFYAHNGSHPLAFTLTTSGVTNSGGNFYGINDGNGNINVHVTGNFINSGSVKIINNSGVAGLSNGNAVFTVDSAFTQSGGDTRIIYNVSTTNSGLFNAVFRNLNLTGGIFMGQSGCRTSGGLCSLAILDNLTINFQNINDKFRGASISSIGASINAVQLSLSVGGNLTISGVLNAEVTSSAAAGSETVTINGNSVINGCNVSFNYGAPSASHASSLTMNGNLSVGGGILFFSRNNGVSSIAVNNNFNLSSGQVTVKGGDSTATMTIGGIYTQTGGQFYIHNSTIASIAPSQVSILNNFSHTSGTFCFDSNPSNISANHVLILSGSTFTVGGNSSITRAAAGQCTSFGTMIFKRNGTISYYRNSTSAVITQVKQEIGKLCTVKVLSGNFLVASYPTPVNDLVKVDGGGSLNVSGNQITSNQSFLYSSLLADSNSTITTQRAQGFYDGTANACVSSNMTFSLHSHCMIEYNGSANQSLTGNFSGMQPVQNQYGILKINMQNASLKAMMNDPVTVRTRLVLMNGELNLGGNTITVNSGTTASITHVNGYINSELYAGLLPGTVVWKNVYKGLHEFPFGVNATTYLPVRLFFISGNATDVIARTYATVGSDNIPVPMVNGTLVNFAGLASTYANTNLIDRWWFIDAPGVIAGLTVSYRGIENTMDPGYQAGQIGIVNWTGSSWSAPACVGSGVTAGIGTVSAEIMSDFSAFTVGRQTGLKMVSNIRSFTAEQVGTEVSLNWSTEVEYNSENFIVERSLDGEAFDEIGREKASGNSFSVLKYSKVDSKPFMGKNYYRIKTISSNGSAAYSAIREITVTPGNHQGISIESYGPNPFESGFGVNYKLGDSGNVHVELSSSNGKLVFQSDETATEGTHRFDFNSGNGLPPGTYILRMTCNDRTVTEKLLKK